MALEETQNHKSSQIKTTKCAVKRSFLMTLIVKTMKMMRRMKMSKNSKIIIVNLPTADNFSKLKKKTEEMKINAQIWLSRCFIKKTLYRDRLKDRAQLNNLLKILRQTIWAAILRWNNYWPKKVSNSRKKLKGITRKMNVWPR